jgi:hypothetical protein
MVTVYKNITAYPENWTKPINNLVESVKLSSPKLLTSSNNPHMPLIYVVAQLGSLKSSNFKAALSHVSQCLSFFSFSFSNYYYLFEGRIDIVELVCIE